MWTGSLINTITPSNPATPVVGQGATILHWTDRSPATVVEVSGKGKTVVVQDDNYQRTDSNGQSESQDYIYSPNPQGNKRTYTLRKNGRWVAKGENLVNGSRVALGNRERYYDYSF